MHPAIPKFKDWSYITLKRMVFCSRTWTLFPMLWSTSSKFCVSLNSFATWYPLRGCNPLEMRRNSEPPVENRKMEHFLSCTVLIWPEFTKLKDQKSDPAKAFVCIMITMIVLCFSHRHWHRTVPTEEVLERSQFSSVPLSSVAPNFIVQHLQQTLTYFAMSFTAAGK